MNKFARPVHQCGRCKKFELSYDHNSRQLQVHVYCDDYVSFKRFRTPLSRWTYFVEEFWKHLKDVMRAQKDHVDHCHPDCRHSHVAIFQILLISIVIYNGLHIILWKLCMMFLMYNMNKKIFVALSNIITLFSCYQSFHSNNIWWQCFIWISLIF